MKFLIPNSYIDDDDNDVDDDDDDDDDDELFLWYGWPTKGVWPYLQPGPLPEILTIVNTRHAASRIEPVQNLNSGFVEWSCAVVIITTPRRHYNQYIKEYQIRN